MSDTANQVGKVIKSNNRNAQRVLKRFVPKLRKIERVLDTFDSAVPFTMEFHTKHNETAYKLDLIFRPPGPSICCDQFLCAACESFADGNETITLQRPYRPNSVTVYVRGKLRPEEFTETNPTTGVVTVNLNIGPGTVVRVCYIYLQDVEDNPFG